MPHSFTHQQILDLEAVLSPPRFGTYLRATGGDRHRAMELYCWNTDLAAAFFVMLQFCEIGTRNGAVEAVEAEFGPNWHLNRGFYHTLPRLRRGRGYQPADDIATQAQRQPTSGKVVAELKSAFWQYLFVQGQDARLWDKHLRKAFPVSPVNCQSLRPAVRFTAAFRKSDGSGTVLLTTNRFSAESLSRTISAYVG